MTFKELIELIADAKMNIANEEDIFMYNQHDVLCDIEVLLEKTKYDTLKTEQRLKETLETTQIYEQSLSGANSRINIMNVEITKLRGTVHLQTIKMKANDEFIHALEERMDSGYTIMAMIKQERDAALVKVKNRDDEIKQQEESLKTSLEKVALTEHMVGTLTNAKNELQDWVHLTEEECRQLQTKVDVLQKEQHENKKDDKASSLEKWNKDHSNKDVIITKQAALLVMFQDNDEKIRKNYDDMVASNEERIKVHVTHHANMVALCDEWYKMICKKVKSVKLEHAGQMTVVNDTRMRTIKNYREAKRQQLDKYAALESENAALKETFAKMSEQPPVDGPTAKPMKKLVMETIPMRTRSQRKKRK